MRLACVVALVSLLGCGDDDVMPADATVDADADARVDAATDARDRPDSRRDAEAEGGVTLTACSPIETTACESADDKCSIVISGSGETAQILFACVPGAAEGKGRSAPCSRVIDLTPSDTTDRVITDDCRQGLVCVRDAARGFDVCQQLCGLPGPDCGRDEFCLGQSRPGDPQFGICNPTSDCDPVFGTGCGEGAACWVLNNSQGDLISSCFAIATDPIALGEACTSLLDCELGAECFQEVTADGMFAGERRCRQICNAGEVTDGGEDDAGEDDAGEDDAGEDDAGEEDASVPDAATPLTGTCSAEGATCRALPHAAGTEVRIASTPGVCQ